MADTRTFVVPTITDKTKIRSVDANDIFSSIAMDLLRITTLNNGLISSIQEIQETSKTALDVLSNELDAIESSIEVLEGHRTTSTTSVSNFSVLDDMEITSTNNLELKTLLFQDYIDNGSVASITATSFPSRKSIEIKVEDIKSSNKESFWREIINLSAVPEQRISDKLYRGIVIDIDIKLNGYLLVNYLYLSPVGRYNVGVEVFLNTKNGTIKPISDTVSDSIDWNSAPDEIQYVNEIKIRLNQDNGTTGLQYKDSTGLMDILKTLLLAPEPDMSVLTNYINTGRNAEYNIVYILGLYSVRAGLKRYARHGRAETNVISLSTPVKNITGNINTDLGQLYIIAPQISDQEYVVVEREFLGSASLDPIATEFNFAADESIPSNIVTEGGKIFHPVISVNNNSYDCKVVNVINSSFSGTDGSVDQIALADSIYSLIPYEISFIPMYAIHDGKIYTNFDINKYSFVMNLSYLPTGVRVKVILNGNGSYSPSIAGYGLVTNDN